MCQRRNEPEARDQAEVSPLTPKLNASLGEGLPPPDVSEGNELIPPTGMRGGVNPSTRLQTKLGAGAM